MLITLSGMIKGLRFSQPRKAEFPIPVTLPGMVMPVRVALPVGVGNVV